MKKRNEWVTKFMKRNVMDDDRGIVDLIWIMSHFFKNLPQWIDEMSDPRNQSYITYTQSDLVFMGLLKNVCGLKSMHQMEEQFNEEACINTLRYISGDRRLEEMPHSDTLNYYLSKLSPDCLSEIRHHMISSLIRGKSFYGGKLLNQCWRVVLDGTGLFCFKERHCENCLVETKKTKNGKKITRYYHKVLEAKIILSDRLVLSLGTEFIENEKEDVSKQDCEIEAAKRLLARIRKEYPQLKICIQADSLYEVEPIIRLCQSDKGNRWHYIFTHKEGRQRLLSENYEWLKTVGETGTVKGIGAERGDGTYANHVDDVAGKDVTANIFEYTCNVRGEQKTFQWLTDIELTRKNLEEMVTAARGRWKIENEGFNNQKNGIYGIGHLNSRNTQAMKNHYLLTQIADIIMQLYLAWMSTKRKAVQSIKSTSSWLLESFRIRPITDEDVLYIRRYTTVYLE